MRYLPQKATLPRSVLVRIVPSRGVRDPGMYGSLSRGSREISTSAQERRAQCRGIGKAYAEADDERNGEVRPVNSTVEAGEQSGETRGGAGGGKCWGRGECDPA